MTRDELVAGFAGFPQRLAQATAAAAERGWMAPPGEWGPAETTRHLIAVERAVWHVRLAEVAAQESPVWSWTEPGPAPEFEASSLVEIQAAFAAARAASVATVLALDDAGWARTGIHATYGVLDVAGLLRLATDHDREHLASIAIDD